MRNARSPILRAALASCVCLALGSRCVEGQEAAPPAGATKPAKGAGPSKGPALTPTDQVTVEKIRAADPQANPKKANNRFCPVTGKLVDPGIPPVACPQRFQHIYILVGVADKEAAERAEKGNENQVRAFKDAMAGAAGSNMMVDDSDPKHITLKAIELPPGQRVPMPQPKDVSVELQVDSARKFQTIDGFGTATYCYNKTDHEVYAKPEFQKLIAEDLGMSMVRFEIVPAHFKPVEKPEQVSRKDFIFEGSPEGIPINEKTGKPAFGPTKGVIPCLEFIAAIKKLNPEIKVTPSVWSPPAWMKTTGKPAGGGSLKPEYYAHYAKYLAEWVLLVKEKYGCDIYALGPQNELEFSEPYNSCIYKPEEFAAVVKVIGQTFRKEGLNVKLFGPEDMTHYGPRTVRFIKAVEDDPAVKPFLNIHATHGYSDGIQSTGSVQENADFWGLIKDYGKPYWQTETGVGAADDRWTDGGPDGQVVDAKSGKLVSGALSSVGGRLHYALAYGNASAWLFWQITEPKPSIHGLMVLDKPGKRYYVAKHFYRWIRPGAVRIAAGPDGGDKGVCVTAYQHEKDKTVTVVLINRSDDNAKVAVGVRADVPVGSFETYRTSEKEDCVTLDKTPVTGGKAGLTLPPRCVVTLYGKGG